MFLKCNAHRHVLNLLLYSYLLELLVLKLESILNCIMCILGQTYLNSWASYSLNTPLRVEARCACACL